MGSCALPSTAHGFNRGNNKSLYLPNNQFNGFDTTSTSKMAKSI